jgi:hypothetical protein
LGILGAITGCGGAALSSPQVDAAVDGPIEANVGSEAGARDADAAPPDAISGADATMDAAIPDTTGDAMEASPDSDAAPPDAVSDGAALDALEAGAPWTPAAIQSKLSFWFDPTSLVQVAGNVVKWTDLSGNGNDAIQPVAAYEPTYTPAGIHGLPSATFPGTAAFLRIVDAASMQWRRSDLVILVVFRGTAQTAQDAMLYQKTGPPPYDGVNLYIDANKPVVTSLAAAQVSGQVYVVSAPPPATFVDGSTHLLGIRRSGATLEVRVDGVVSGSITQAEVATTDVSAIGSDAIIGQNGSSPQALIQQFAGDIAEMVGVGGPLTPNEVARLESYMKTRYGIP